MTRDNDHSAAGIIGNTQERLVGVERRLGGVPRRLRGLGYETTSWNDALLNGFYWSAAGVPGAPFATMPFTGIVTVVGDVVEQRLSVASDLTTNEWVRRRTALGAWSAWRRTDGIRIPTSVVGGVFDPVSGRINLTQGTKNWSLNGIFDAGTRAYHAEYGFYTGGPNIPFVRLRNAGVDYVAATHYNVLTYNNGSTPTAVNFNATTWANAGAVDSSGHFGSFDIQNPMTTTGNNSQKRLTGRNVSSVGNNPSLCDWGTWISGADVSPFDGLTFGLTNQGASFPGVTATSESFIVVKGVG